MVVNAYHGIDIFFAECTYKVVCTLLHFGVCTLHGIELNTTAIAASIDRTYRTATKADAIVITADYNHLVALLWCAFEAVALGAVAYTAGEHNYFVVAILLAILLMLKGEHRTSDERLAKLVAEV